MRTSLNVAGGIYFISFPHCSDFVKIGLSTIFINRFSQLQTSSPHPLIVEMIFPIPGSELSTYKDVEQKFHNAFDRYRGRGEWFSKTGKLAKLIFLKQQAEPESRIEDPSGNSRVFGWNHDEDVDWDDMQPCDLSSDQFMFSKCGSTGLTPREIECAAYIGKGLNNQEIAARMSVSIETVKTFVSSSLCKLNLTNRTQLAAESVRRGWLFDLNETLLNGGVL